MIDAKYAKLIVFAVSLIILVLIVWYANGVFLLTFASILLAILLNSIGRGTQKLTRLPYPLALLVALIFILGLLTLIFWLYSPLIAEQFELLMTQLPQAYANLTEYLTPFLGSDFLTHEKLQNEFSISNQKLLTQLLSFFSSTVGSIAGFVIFLIVGFYLAFNPTRYDNWIFLLIPSRKQKKARAVVYEIGQSLRWWILGKLLSMAVVGLLTFIGLTLLHVSLAVILGFLAALLTFIPYVGPILAAIPAVLIGFAQSPWTGLYVIILYTGINVADGYFITPYIEQRTVAIPPALSILAQVLLLVLIGGIGLALATPLAVVVIALVAHHYHASDKLVHQTQKPNDE